MATVGIINGMVDLESMAAGFPDWSMNNTYGLPAYNESIYAQAVGALTAPDEGCLGKIRQCRDAANELDPDSYGTSEEVNGKCVNATEACSQILGAYEQLSPVSSLFESGPERLLMRVSRSTTTLTSP